MDISVRYLHNDIIKPYENGGLESVVDSATHKFLKIGTILRSFILPQVRKMNHNLRQICGCELCIITKVMLIGLNIFKTELVSDLQHRYVGIHMFKTSFSTKSAAHYKYNFFSRW